MELRKVKCSEVTGPKPLSTQGLFEQIESFFAALFDRPEMEFQGGIAGKRI
jgi:hypothetical protein